MSTDAKQAPERPHADVVALKGPKPLPTPSQPPRPDERPAPRDDAATQLAPNDGREAKAPLPDGEHHAAENLAEDNASHAGEQGHESFLRRHRHLFLIGTPLAIFLAVAGYMFWDYSSHFESTDDAFVEARQFAIAPKVPGYITEVAVTDNQRVKTGDLIARIDRRDYRVALEQAQAQVAAATANIENIDAQIEIQQAQISASKAQVEQAQAALTFAEQQAARYKDLAAREAGTVQMAEQTVSRLRQDQASLRNTQAAVVVAQRQVHALLAQRTAAEASLAQANAQRDQALLNLSYTTMTAAQAGRVVNLTAAVGQYAQAGTNFSLFVPDELWVIANYKETQLADMRPGQPVTMRIDAYPSRVIRGHVDSVQPGSGTAFSLLPAQNATGNYVKIVQRVPVKIAMDDPPADVALGPGMSVVPVVRVRAGPSLYERLLGRR
ncbi:MAG: HlyD family secretion protein [Hyphomicrobiaceae bacterium]